MSKEGGRSEEVRGGGLHALSYKPTQSYHVDVLEFLEEFAVPIFQSVGLINDTHTPLDVAQLTLRCQDDLVRGDDDIKFVGTRDDATLQ